MKSLQRRKTLLFKQILKSISKFRNKVTTKINIVFTTFEIDVFEYLRKVFSKSSMLIHFVLDLQLYVNIDSFKTFDFAEMMYHIIDNKIKSILYLSRELNSIERNYWSTELEIAELVWVLRKIKNMMKSTQKSFTIVYIDNSTFIFIVKQYSLTTTNTNKLNLWLVRASQYLFVFELEVRHKSDKQNLISNVLSRLLRERTTFENLRDEEDILNVSHIDSLNKFFANCIIYVFTTSLIKISSDFRAKLTSAIKEDKK